MQLADEWACDAFAGSLASLCAQNIPEEQKVCARETLILLEDQAHKMCQEQNTPKLEVRIAF